MSFDPQEFGGQKRQSLADTQSRHRSNAEAHRQLLREAQEAQSLAQNAESPEAKRAAFMREFGVKRLTKLKHMSTLSHQLWVSVREVTNKRLKMRQKLKTLNANRTSFLNEVGQRTGPEIENELRDLDTQIEIVEAAVSSLDESYEKVHAPYETMLRLKEACFNEIEKRYGTFYMNALFNLIDGDE